MILGILSDTHGRADAMEAAMHTLQAAGAEYFIHCGDVGGTKVLDHLAGLPSAFVFGNTDFQQQQLTRYAAQLPNVRCLGAFGELELDGRKLAVMHGDDWRLKARLLSDQLHDYLFQGHTHLPEQRLIGRTCLVNPGALHRAAPKTVAILDTHGQAARFLEVHGI